jgi:hypothetical protein
MLALTGREASAAARSRSRWAGPCRWGVLPIALCAATGCGGSEDRAPPLGTGKSLSGCEEFSYRTCDILEDGCQRELFGLMACLHGDVDAGQPPPVRQLDEASAIALVSETSDALEMAGGLDAMQDEARDQRAFFAGVRGLELLGMLSPGLIQDEADVLEVTVASRVAFYLVPTKEVVIIDRGDPVTNLEANSVLGHEFLHALQDRRHDLGGFDAAYGSSDSDTVLALSSLIEGEATFYQYMLTFAYRGIDVDKLDFEAFLADLTSFGTDLTRDEGSPAVTASGIFPYTYGTRYAGRRWLSGGNGELDAAYQDPPLTTLEVLGSAPAASELGLFDPSPVALDGYEVTVDDAVGAWVTAAMLSGLEPIGSRPAPLADLASHWRGDRYWIYQTAEEGDGSVAALWAIDWDSAEAAAQFASAAAALAPEGAALHIDTSGVSTRVTSVERAEDLDAWRARLAEAAPPRLER